MPGGPTPWRGPQIKLNKFSGSRQEYRAWRDEVQVVLKLHSVPADKQVLLLYLALEEGKGRPRDLFSNLSVDEVSELEPEDVWKRLNKEYLEEKYIEADEALADYDRCRRVPGQSMRDYLMHLRLTRVRMEKEDPGSRVSDLSFARRMLRRAGLTKIEQRQVLGTAGAAWDVESIETSLVMMFGDAHTDDKSRLHRSGFDGGRDSRPARNVSDVRSTSAGSSHSRASSFGGRSSSRGSRSRGGRGFRGTFASGITEEEELEHSEESDDEAMYSSRSPLAAAAAGEVAGTFLADPEEDRDAQVLLDSEDSGNDLPEGEEELLEIYFQGLRAKKRLQAPGQGKPLDKSKSTCKDCKKIGHWAGDEECELVKSGQKPRFSASTAFKDKPKWQSKPSFGRKPRDAAVVQKVLQDADEQSDVEETGLFTLDAPPEHDPLVDEIARRRRELQKLERAVSSRVLTGDGPMVLPERAASADSWEDVEQPSLGGLEDAPRAAALFPVLWQWPRFKRFLRRLRPTWSLQLAHACVHPRLPSVLGASRPIIG